tara:strand:- start:445 stop:1221 length:777 start_codon:yes stop_codon:yes gene_type:complete
MPRIYKNNSSTPKVNWLKTIKSWIAFRLATRRRDQPSRFKHAVDLIDNLNGGYPAKSYARLKAANFGHEVLNGKNALPKLLCNLERLQKLAPDTLGRMYYEINKNKSDVFKTLSKHSHTTFVFGDPEYTDEYKSFLRRSVDVHDMIHLVMGFDRKLFGEANVLVAAAHGGSSPYFKWAVIVPTLLTRTFDSSRLKYFFIAVKILLQETPRRCSSVDNWELIHWESMLEMNIHEVRKQLGVPDPVLYKPNFFLVSEERT